MGDPAFLFSARSQHLLSCNGRSSFEHWCPFPRIHPVGASLEWVIDLCKWRLVTPIQNIWESEAKQNLKRSTLVVLKNIHIPLSRNCLDTMRYNFPKWYWDFRNGGSNSFSRMLLETRETFFLLHSSLGLVLTYNLIWLWASLRIKSIKLENPFRLVF